MSITIEYLVARMNKLLEKSNITTRQAARLLSLDLYLTPAAIEKLYKETGK